MAKNSFKIKDSANLEPKVLSSILSPQSGDIACDINDSNKIKYYDSTTTSWKPMGGGAPSLDTVFQLFAEEPISSWTMLTPGGQGSFTKVTSGQLHGDASYRMTLGTFNNLLSGPIEAVDPRFRGNAATLYFPYTFDGTNTDLRIQLISNPSGTPVNLIPDDIYVQGTNGGNGIYKINVNIPVNCTQIQFRVSQIATNIGKIFNFDDIQLTTDQTIYANINNITPWVNAGPITIGAVTTAPTKGATTTDSVLWRQVGESYEVQYKFRQTTGGGTGSGEYLVSLPSNIDIDTNTYPVYTSAIPINGSDSSFTLEYSTDSQVVSNGTTTLLRVTGVYPYTSKTFRLALNAPGISAGTFGSTYYSLNEARTFSFTIRFKGKGLLAQSPTIVMANETFSTDSANLAYSSTYNLTTLASAPVGTFITFTYAANTNTRVQTSTAPTQSVADMNANGIQIFTRAYNAASTAAQPAAVAIQIGKGMKGVTPNLYKSTGKSTSGSTEWGLEATAVDYGFRVNSYNENTGVLAIDGGVRHASITTAYLLFSDLTTATNGYLVINASKSPALTGLGLPNVYMNAEGNAGQVITANVTDIPFIKLDDSRNSWSGTTYTVPETGIYSISVGVAFTASITGAVSLFNGGSAFKYLGFTTTNGVLYGNTVIKLNAGFTFTVRTSTGGTLINLTPGHYLTVTKVSVG